MMKEKKHSAYVVGNTMYPAGPDWEHMDLQLDELIEKEDWDSIGAYVLDNEELLFKKWIADGHEFLDRTLKAGSFCMTLTADMLSMDARANALFRIGSLYGMLDILEKQVNYEKEELYSVQLVEKALSSVKNLDEIVLLLEQNGTLTHSSLAHKLGDMNLPTLTDNMKKVIGRGLAYSQIYGRYKQYYLTDTGRAYARNLRKRRKTDMGLEQVESLLKNWLNDSAKAESVQEMIDRLQRPMEDTKQEAFLRTAMYGKEDTGLEPVQREDRYGKSSHIGNRAKAWYEVADRVEGRIVRGKTKTRIHILESAKREDQIVSFTVRSDSTGGNRNLYVAAFQGQGRLGSGIEPEASTLKTELNGIFKKYAPVFSNG